MLHITKDKINKFKTFLIGEERSKHTIDKYMRDIRSFIEWLGGRSVDKNTVLNYKRELCKKYAPKSVNSILSSINALFTFLNWHELKVKTMKIQQQIFADNEKELTKAEYDRLLTAAKNKQNERLYYLMQTIGSTGIRVSELEYVTCEAVALGQVRINCKGKIRVIFLPKQLCKMLKIYIKQQKITGGSVFVSKNGKPLDRSNIWKMMKALCKMTLNQHTINCYFLPLISYSIFLGRKTTDKCNKISCRRSRKQFHNGRGVQIDMCKVTYFVTSFFDF